VECGPRRSPAMSRPTFQAPGVDYASLAIANPMPPPSPDARFKGYTSFVVQKLVLHSHVIDFRCERWLTATSSAIVMVLSAAGDVARRPAGRSARCGILVASLRHRRDDASAPTHCELSVINFNGGTTGRIARPERPRAALCYLGGGSLRFRRTPLRSHAM
jgi:hypothetical protein